MDFTLLLQSPIGILLIGVFGLAVGSFLNVVIYRLPIMMTYEEKQYAWEIIHGEGEKHPDVPKEPFNLSYPASRCPHCHALIRFWQNIPIVSYLVQRGRCANCRTKITPRYLLVELFCAVISVLVVLKYPEPVALGFALLFTWGLIALFFIDAEQQLLPDIITLPLMWLGIIAALLGLYVPLEMSVMGAIVGYLILWSIYWAFKLITGREGMGYGDFKLLAALCAWQGLAMLPMILFIAGTLGLIFARVNRVGRGVPMAFGPYLIIGGWITFMYGNHIAALLGFDLAMY